LKTKGFIILSCFAILLSGCMKNQEKNEENQEQKNYSITTETELFSYYQTSAPYKPAEARGLILDKMVSRIEADELELGLMELSQEYFDPEDYLYQDGQYIKAKELSAWLKRKSDHKEGLNPPLKISKNDDWKTKIQKEKKSPEYLAYILEQNYLNKNGELAGISIGIALNSIYHIRVFDEKGLTHFDEVKINNKELEKFGKEVAQEILVRLRGKEKLEKVPIFISLYKQQDKGSVKPGNFFASTYVNGNDTSIGSWDEVERKYYLFPSKEGEKFDKETATKMKNVKEEIQEYFPHTDVKLFGKGLYINRDLKRLQMYIPIEPVSKTELVAFTQYTANLMATGGLSSYVPISVTILSVNEPKSVIIFEPKNSKPLVHIYKK
jgi:protein involved in sex pheromone biosynthesis